MCVWKLSITKGRVTPCEKIGPWGRQKNSKIQRWFLFRFWASKRSKVSHIWSSPRDVCFHHLVIIGDWFLPFNCSQVIFNPSPRMTHLYHRTLGYDWASIKWGGSESREIYPRKCSKSPQRGGHWWGNWLTPRHRFRGKKTGQDTVIRIDLLAPHGLHNWTSENTFDQK